MRFSGTASIFRSSIELSAPLHVAGTIAPIRALIAGRYSQFIAEHSTKISPIVVLCPNDETAEAFCSDLECLAQTVDQNSLRIEYFPTWEQSPYSSIAPSLKTRLERLSVLSQLIQNHPPDFLVTTLPALSQATLPQSLFQHLGITLRVGKNILPVEKASREEWIRQLVDCGYLRIDPVEDPGTFSVRGEIIDLFPPGRTRPVRIELFDTEVEKIREFDPITQLTLSGDTSSLQELFIPPAREVLIHPSTRSSLRENLKSRADDQGIPRATRDPLLTALQYGNYPDHSDAWAPFAYPEPSTLWDYLPPSCPVIWNDELSCFQEWDKFYSEQKQLSEGAAQSGIIIPKVEALFRWNSELEASIRNQTRFYLDRIELTQVSNHLENLSNTQLDRRLLDSSKEPDSHLSTQHSVSVQRNTDLTHGSRHPLAELDPQVRLWMKQKFNILVLSTTLSQLERIRFLLEERGFHCELTDKSDAPLIPSVIVLKLGDLSEGFRWVTEGLVVLTEDEILGSSRTHGKRRKSSPSGQASSQASGAKEWSGLQALSDLSVGDAVVHIDHGIGRYQGLSRLDLSGAPSDFLLVEYANKDKLYLPVYRLNVIQKYVGAGEGVALDRLGSQQFSKTKEKVKDSVKKLAIDLIQLYAERKIRPGIQFSPRSSEFREFEARFPFEETPDQLKAIDAVLKDLESGRTMDRLVCGDVGYGKTEVAIRAAFQAVSEGKQVAVLVPTTVLAQQHEQSFKNRLKDYPFLIESISRFKSPKEQRILLEALAEGKIDIIIGTHRLLSKDVKFQDLGLVIIDEEHRFGVEHKERLKAFKINTHVLTLTATPIPRTLHMALSGLRDISLINTPPIDRLPIRTFVSKYDDSLIQRAIEFELARGGQVFFLHNRVQTIYEVSQRIRELIPTAQIIVAHGQMAEHQLEEAMLSFYQKKANVLVCTTIIESGLDLPSANTIMINRADTLGLAQLYQLRGRVGRSHQRAYAYLLIPAEGGLTEEAKRRLEVIQRFVELGSGFSIASHDLEIRGGGDLLGPQQSGNIHAVGFELYTELLEEAIRELQGKPLSSEEKQREPEIKVPFPAYLGETYVPDVHQRLSLYRRLSASTRDTELNRLEEELRDRFGNLPVEAQNLIWLIRIKLLLKTSGIDALTVGTEKISLLPGPQSKFNPVRTISLVSAYPNRYQLTPDSRLIVKFVTRNLRDLLFELEGVFKSFSG